MNSTLVNLKVVFFRARLYSVTPVRDRASISSGSALWQLIGTVKTNNEIVHRSVDCRCFIFLYLCLTAIVSLLFQCSADSYDDL